tara:strand:+ start:1957 stop:2076 length:120 start_codon:yes stop_codon:yes gene_type:complete
VGSFGSLPFIWRFAMPRAYLKKKGLVVKKKAKKAKKKKK